MLPAINFEGKILMQSPSQIKLVPNGNGALFDAIKTNSDVNAVVSSV
jgi:UDP-N-acetylglucosamine pyrophosphorylase